MLLRCRMHPVELAHAVVYPLCLWQAHVCVNHDASRNWRNTANWLYFAALPGIVFTCYNSEIRVHTQIQGSSIIRLHVTMRHQATAAPSHANSCSMLLQGFDGFLSGKENRRSRQAKVVTPDEFIFSLSSMTSEVWNKLQPSQDIQDGDYAPMGTGKRVCPWLLYE